jgi:outer membrane protein assembly factor BamE
MTSWHPLTARSCGLFLTVSLAACSFVEDPVAKAMKKMTPYRAEVVQGNFVSKEQLQALRPGMSRKQVREILGTPLIASVFHADRWDYAFTIRRKGTPPQQRKLSVFFQNDLFLKVETEDLPSEAEFAERIASPDERQKPPRLQATPQELEKFRQSSPPSTPIEPVVENNTQRKQYPPLESPAR